VSVLLNLDGGELEDEPEELFALADLVHVACGGHAGDAASMTRAVERCARLGTRVGAHPSFVDREGFGRRRLEVSAEVLEGQIAEQCRQLRAVAEARAVRLTSAKPHGALYHAANADPALARACARAVSGALGPVALVGPPAGELPAAAGAAGLAYLREAFCDRGVRADGSLVPRGEPGALLHDPAAAAARARVLAARPDIETLCIHADTEGALAIARAVRAALGPRAS
jgi:5-oxoprolinase (ATP-hydrolysing) subunit A